jgi:Flp pilus assembly protein TadG
MRRNQSKRNRTLTRRRDRPAGSNERGASLVEFALVAPFLLVMLFGVIDASWVMAQNNDVRQGVREAARLAAVNGGDVSTMGTSICRRMDLASGQVVTFTDSPAGKVGELAKVGVTAPMQTLSGYTPVVQFFGGDLSSEIEFRLEQPSIDWSTGSHTC